MTRQEAFEAHWADVHDVPAESMEKYRWADEDGYRLPDMAKAYRNFCAGWDAGMKKTFTTVAPHIKQCLVCADPQGHGGLQCPRTIPFSGVHS